MKAPKKYEAKVWAVPISSISVRYKKTITDDDNPRMIKTTVDINLFLLINFDTL